MVSDYVEEAYAPWRPLFNFSYHFILHQNTTTIAAAAGSAVVAVGITAILHRTFYLPRQEEFFTTLATEASKRVNSIESFYTPVIEHYQDKVAERTQQLIADSETYDFLNEITGHQLFAPYF